jgi:hypothetical protein
VRPAKPRIPTRNIYSPAHWQAILARFDASGITQEAFCRRESLAISTFNKWRKRLKRDPIETAAGPRFVELGPPSGDTHVSGWDIELDLGDGRVLRLRRSR